MVKVLTELLCVADFLDNLFVGLIAHFYVFPNIDELGSHVELLITHILDLSQELVLPAAINPSFDRDMLGNGMGEGA